MSAQSTPNSTPVLSVTDLLVSFEIERASVEAVRGVSLEVSRGECLGVVGESGSGKTQMFMAAMGLLAKNGRARGSVQFEGEQLLGRAPAALNKIRGSKLCMVFQDSMTSLTPHLKVGVQLSEVLVQHRGFTWREAERTSLEALERVLVTEPTRRLGQYPHELSGGMRQRVMIAMGLLCGPTLLIADEPTSSLDVTVQAQIIDLLLALRLQSGMSLVLISHDLGVVAAVADRVAVMYAGRIVEFAPANKLLSGARHPYTAALMQCVPNLHDARLERMPCLPGQAPGPSDPEGGCAFAPRCPRAADRCRSERPVLRSVDVFTEVACHFPCP